LHSKIFFTGHAENNSVVGVYVAILCGILPYSRFVLLSRISFICGGLQYYQPGISHVACI